MKKRIKKILPAAVSLILLAAPLAAQAELEIFGYLETQYLGTGVQGDFHQIFSNKLRVDIKKELTQDFSFAANFTYKTFHGKKRWDILRFLPPSLTAGIPEEMRGLYVFPFFDQDYLDNAYISLAFRSFDLTMGKQQISLGTGYAWNPTDVFNIKDLMDPTYEQPGFNALRLDVFLGKASSLTCLYSPDETWRDSARMVRLKTRIFHFDLSLLAIEKTWRFHDYEVFDAASKNFLEQPEKRRLLGAAAAGELLGLGVWFEGAYNWMGRTKDFFEMVAGFDYTFDFQTYIMVEFYRNTLGRTDFSMVTLNDWMRLYANEQKTVSRNQAFLLIRHPATDFLDVGLSTVASLSDGSLALVPTLSYSLSDNVELTAYLSVNIGKAGKAYGRSSGTGGMMRARVYF
jgi:hypothetical protein